jgi:hypothetical protein
MVFGQHRAMCINTPNPARRSNATLDYQYATEESLFFKNFSRATVENGAKLGKSQAAGFRLNHYQINS